MAGLEPDVDLAEVFDHRSPPAHMSSGRSDSSLRRCHTSCRNVGVRLAADGVVIAYTTDTGPHDVLAELARDADLYVVDATDRPRETDCGERNLLTAAESGQWAQSAGAHWLLLTHLWPGTDPVASADRARKAFAGPVEVATRGLVIDLCACYHLPQPRGVPIRAEKGHRSRPVEPDLDNASGRDRGRAGPAPLWSRGGLHELFRPAVAQPP